MVIYLTFSVGKRGKVFDKFGNLRDDVEDDSLLSSSGEYNEQTVDGAFLVSINRGVPHILINIGKSPE